MSRWLRPATIAGAGIVLAAGITAAVRHDEPARPVAAGTPSAATVPSTTADAATTSTSSGTATTIAAPAATSAPRATTAPPPAASGAPRPADEPASPEEAARRLEAAHAVIHDPAATPAALAAAGEQQELAARAVGLHPEWTAPTLALLSGAVRDQAAHDIHAATEIAALAAGLPPRDTLPPWRILAPAPADALVGFAHEAEQATTVPWAYLVAINLVETRTGRIHVPESYQGHGPMQFLPGTWARYGAGGDVNDPHDAYLGAARLLRANGAPGDMPGALHHYNRSPHYGRAVGDYAAVLLADPAAARGYHAWPVLLRVAGTDYVLPEGFVGPGA